MTLPRTATSLASVLVLPALLLAQTMPTTDRAPRTGELESWTVATLADPDRLLAVASFDASGLVGRSGDTDVRVAPEGLIRLSRSARTAIASDLLVLLLRDGQRIPGVPTASGSPELLGWKHPALGTFKFPLRLVQGVARGMPQPETAATPPTEDVVTLLNGDVIRGVLIETSADTLSLQPTSGDPVTVPWRSVRKLSLVDLAATTAPTATAPVGYRLELTDGARLLAKEIRIADGKLLITPEGSPEVAVSVTSASLIEKLGGNAQSLSLLTPAKITHLPYLTAARPPTFDTAGGGLIRAAGKAYPRGISTTARTTLVWNIPPGFRKLRLAYALEEAATRGSASVRVLAGEKIILDTPDLRPGAPAPAATVDLGDATTLTFEVDFGQSAGVQARVNFLDPLLLK